MSIPRPGTSSTADYPYDNDFSEHVKNLRGTMFYVCQGSCLCGTVNNRGKVIYCYGDLVPRHGELFAEGADSNGRSTSKDLLAAQLGIWTFGIIALLIVLLLIRKSIASLRQHIEKVTDRLPLHFDDDLMSNNSTASPGGVIGAPGKDATMDTMSPPGFSDSTMTPEHEHGGGEDMDAMLDEELMMGMSIGKMGASAKGVPVEKLKQMRIGRKDFKKGGQALRGVNVTEKFRVKEKDVRRTMK